jgi:beta-glucosidase
MHRTLSYVTCFAILLISAVSTAQADEPASVVPVPRDAKWLERHTQINDRAKQGNVDVIFLGDSITQGWNDNAVWKKYYGDRHAMNAGIGGDQTQHVLWRLDNGNIDGIKPKVAVIMIGTNNCGSGAKPEDIAAGVKAIVAKLRSKLPETKILLLGIFPRDEKADGAKRLVNKQANQLYRDVADGKNVVYLDIGDKFLAADGTLPKETMPDFLHLTEKGYEIWASSIEAKLAELLGDKAKS